MIRTYNTPDAAVALLKKWGAKTAIRCGAQGPNNNIRRGWWRIDGGLGMDNGRLATASEARQLNALAYGYGVQTFEVAPGEIEALTDRSDA